MARRGLSKPYFAIYSYNEIAGTVTYSNGALMGKAVELGLELDNQDDNNLYADNGIAETATNFSGGSLTLTTDDLMPETMMKVLGIKEQAIEGSETSKWYVFDDSQNAPYMGFGAIIKGQKNNTIYWQALVLPKIKLNNPADTYTTEGESVEWQTPEIGGSVLRSDINGHPWKYLSSTFATEAEAETAIKGYLNIE